MRGIINISRGEQRLARVPLNSLTVQEISNMLRSVAHTTNKEFAYNSEDTLEGNLTKRTGSIIPDSMDDLHACKSI